MVTIGVPSPDTESPDQAIISQDLIGGVDLEQLGLIGIWLELGLEDLPGSRRYIETVPGPIFGLAFPGKVLTPGLGFEPCRKHLL
jgi:hypothetical protein